MVTIDGNNITMIRSDFLLATINIAKDGEMRTLFKDDGD